MANQERVTETELADLRILGCVGGVIIVLIAFIYLPVLKGLAVFLMWNWFLVPYGAAPLTLPIAVGLGLFASMLAFKWPDKTEQNEDGFVYTYFMIFARPLISYGLFLLIGYIVSLVV